MNIEEQRLVMEMIAAAEEAFRKLQRSEPVVDNGNCPNEGVLDRFYRARNQLLGF